MKKLDILLDNKILSLIIIVICLASFLKPWLLINGILIGSLYSLGSIGLSLIYGNLKLANMAHGDFMTLSSYIALTLMMFLFPNSENSTSVGPFTFKYELLLVMPLAVIIIGFMAVILDILIFKKLRKLNATSAAIALCSLGLAVSIRGLILFIWGTDSASFPRESKLFWDLPFRIKIPPDMFFCSVVAVIIAIIFYLVLFKTTLGKAIRATSDNPDLARITGINTDRIILYIWFIGGILAATAGILISVQQALITPVMGWKILIPLFAAVIVGGIGNPLGALIGGILIGITGELATGWINPSYKPAVYFFVLLIVLLLRPNGILGNKGRQF